MSLDIGAIEHAYRRYARFYDFCFGAVFQPGRKAIIDCMDCKPGERILEVGVGTGIPFPLYSGDVAVIGIDISSDMLDQARARKAHARLAQVRQLLVMDAEHMQFEDDSFDKGVAMHVASVVPDPERLIDEMRRICKPDGQIYIVNHFQNQSPLLSSFERLPACDLPIRQPLSASLYGM